MIGTGVREPDAADDFENRQAPARRSTSVVLWAVIGVCALVVAVTGGYLGGRHSGSSAQAGIADSSVDAGFARDMSTHHTQAVTMAGYVRDHTKDQAVYLVAYDIDTTQQFQLGEMQGWLDDWGLSRDTTRAQMAWMHGTMQMASDGLMPGMATPAQLATLESSTGKTMDVLFLQLMIRHHQGGVAMAQYAAAHAGQTYVRNLAQAMVTAQSNEIVQMEQQLRKLGGTPLPPPSS